jgi:mono/diheme cytochrome c family protein
MAGDALLFAALLAMASMPRLAHAGADDGKATYEKQCKICHSIAGDKGKMGDKGGALDGVGAKHDAAWLKAYLQDPKSKNPDSKMPKMKVTDQQIDDLVAFLLTLE